MTFVGLSVYSFFVDVGFCTSLERSSAGSSPKAIIASVILQAAMILEDLLKKTAEKEKERKRTEKHARGREVGIGASIQGVEPLTVAKF
jgi:hypothetical protein